MSPPVPCPRCGAVYPRGPRCRCNPALLNPRRDIGPGRLGVALAILALAAWGIAVILSVWARTCGLGVGC